MGKIAGLIITLNEANNIEQCIDSLDFVDQVFVFDSYSSDDTVELAKNKKATVIQRVFDNYASQRNAAFDSIPASFDWIIMLDADEQITPELKKELGKELSKENNPITMYRLRRKDYFMGKWIKHSSGYPTWFGRIFSNGKVRVEREINEEYYTDGKIGHLKEHIIHFPFSKGIEWWFEKHNRYSSMEAKTLIRKLNEKPNLNDLFSSDPTIRRKAQKGFSFLIPNRPLVVFVALYILRLGFLDGKAGYIFCKLRKTYEWMIDLKIKELEKSK